MVVTADCARRSFVFRQPVLRFIIVWALSFTSCSHLPTVLFGLEQSSDQIRELWQSSVTGRITQLKMAAQGRHFLVATLQQGESSVALWSSEGRELWKMSVPGGLRSMDLSANGQRVVISSRTAGVQLLDEKGKVLWKNSAICDVHYLEIERNVLCSYLGESRSSYAFMVLNLEEGEKIFSYPASRTLTHISRSPLSGGLLLGQTGGQIAYLDQNYKTRFRSQVNGEIIAVSLASHGNFLAVLSQVTARPALSKGVAQKVTLFEFNLEQSQATVRQLAEVPLAQHYQVVQLSHSPAGTGSSNSKVLLYGNGIKGQFLQILSLQQQQSSGSKLVSTWNYHYPHHGDFDSQLWVDGETFTVGLSGHIKDNTHNLLNYLFEFDVNGRVQWRYGLEAEVKAYLVSTSRQQTVRYKVVGTDSSKLFFFATTNASK